MQGILIMNKVIRLLILPAILFCSFFVANSTFATSVYDNILVQTPSVKIVNVNESYDEDFSLNWSQFITNSSFWTGGTYGITQSVMNGYFQTALTNGSGWAVTQYSCTYSASNCTQPVSYGDKYFTIFISPSASNNINFQTSSTSHWVNFSTTSYYAQIKYNVNTNLPYVFATGTTPLNSFDPAPIAFGRDTRVPFNTLGSIWVVEQFLLNAETISYPSGYIGEPIQEEYASDIFPEVDYNIIQKLGIFTVTNGIEEDFTHATYIVTYGTIEGDPQLQFWEKTVALGDNFRFTFPKTCPEDTVNEQCRYTIQVYFSSEDGTIQDGSGETNISLDLIQNTNLSGTCSEDSCYGENSINKDEIDCSVIEDLSDRIFCKSQKLNEDSPTTGLVFITLSMFSSIFVSDNIQCNAPVLTTETITLNGSDITAFNDPLNGVCAKMDEIRETFNFSYLVNFMFALGIVAMIFRIINHATSDNEEQFVPEDRDIK